MFITTPSLGLQELPQSCHHPFRGAPYCTVSTMSSWQWLKQPGLADADQLKVSRGSASLGLEESAGWSLLCKGSL